MIESQGSPSTFIYDGDGNRVQDTENGQTTLYINRYYEKNITTGEVTSHYYLGDREVAFRKGTTLEYVHQDSLGSTSVTSNSSGTAVNTIKYYPFGDRRFSTDPLDTDKLFTGQRLDSSGLYFYNARYYDATIGRFISADTIVPDYTDPQAFNRYSYVINNPLKYTDPTGHFWDWVVDVASVAFDVAVFAKDPSWGNAGLLTADVVLGVIPFVPAGAGYVNKAGKVGKEVVTHGDEAVKLVDKGSDAARLANRAEDAGGVLKYGDNNVEKFVPNPYGRRGSPVHRAKIDEIEKQFDSKGWKILHGGSRPEKMFGGRYPDLVMKKEGQKIAIQIGKTTQDGLPIARERKAFDALKVTNEFDQVIFFGY